MPFKCVTYDGICHNHKICTIFIKSFSSQCSLFYDKMYYIERQLYCKLWTVVALFSTVLLFHYCALFSTYFLHDVINVSYNNLLHNVKDGY